MSAAGNASDVVPGPPKRVDNYLPSSRSFRGPYLSMTMPMGSVMADSRKDPMVKARFSLSSWSLQMGQPFISRCSSGSSVVDTLELFSATTKKGRVHLAV